MAMAILPIVSSVSALLHSPATAAMAIAAVRRQQNPPFAQIPLEKVKLSALIKELPGRHGKQHNSSRLPKVPLILTGIVPDEMPLIGGPQRQRHVQMDGELQERQREDRMAPSRAGKGRGEHDEEHPHRGEGDVDIVLGRVVRMRGGDEVGKVAAAGRGVGLPGIEAEAEEDGEDEVHCCEEVGAAVAGGEVDGAEASDVPREEVGCVVGAGGGLVEAEGAVGPADEGGGAGDAAGFLRIVNDEW